MNINAVTTFASYIDDDSASVVISDQNSYALSELNEQYRSNNNSSSMEGEEILFAFTTETLLNVTIASTNSTVSRSEGYRDSLSIIVPITICYLIIFIAGVLGNVITCVVIAKNKTMHTATNYYLFNLAISDFFVLIFGEYAYARFHAWAF